jgi:hypothetical protein
MAAIARKLVVMLTLAMQWVVPLVALIGAQRGALAGAMLCSQRWRTWVGIVNRAEEFLATAAALSHSFAVDAILLSCE